MAVLAPWDAIWIRALSGVCPVILEEAAVPGPGQLLERIRATWVVSGGLYLVSGPESLASVALLETCSFLHSLIWAQHGHMVPPAGSSANRVNIAQRVPTESGSSWPQLSGLYLRRKEPLISACL